MRLFISLNPTNHKNWKVNVKKKFMIPVLTSGLGRTYYFDQLLPINEDLNEDFHSITRDLLAETLNGVNSTLFYSSSTTHPRQPSQLLEEFVKLSLAQKHFLRFSLIHYSPVEKAEDLVLNRIISSIINDPLRDRFFSCSSTPITRCDELNTLISEAMENFDDSEENVLIYR